MLFRSGREPGEHHIGHGIDQLQRAIIRMQAIYLAAGLCEPDPAVGSQHQIPRYAQVTGQYGGLHRGIAHLERCLGLRNRNERYEGNDR